MDENQAKEFAYSITIAVQTMVEAMGMQAENQARACRNEPSRYLKADFSALIENNGCHHNAFLARGEG